MFSDLARKSTETGVTRVARVVAATGLTPNAVTLIGVAMMFGIGWVIAQGHLVLSGFLIIFASLFDALDGSLARYTNRVTKFGGFLDSVTDRYAELAIFAGLQHYLLFKKGYDTQLIVYLTLAALFGSVMVSYNRARAEGLGFECKGGWFSRFERLVVIIASLILSHWFGDKSVFAMLVIMGVFTNITAVQRIMLVKQADDQERERAATRINPNANSNGNGSAASK